MNERDAAALTVLNERFIDAFREGSWPLLAPILAPTFSYMDGSTGETWTMDRYIAELEGHPLPTIGIDEVRIHVDGDVAVVSARSFSRPGRFNRYIDTYARRDGSWTCVHACVWPLVAE